MLLLYFADVFDSIAFIKVARMLIGASVAPSFLCCCKVSAEFFRKQYSLLMALSTGVGCCGGFVATACTAKLVKLFGWQEVIYLYYGAWCATSRRRGRARPSPRTHRVLWRGRGQGG